MDLIKKLEETDGQSPNYSGNIEAYLALIFNSTFTGEVSPSKEETDGAREKYPLGMLLKELHGFVESGRALTHEADEILQKIIDIRCQKKPKEMKTKMKNDYNLFLKMKAQRDVKIKDSIEAASRTWFGKALKPIAHLQDQSFWGTGHQLRSGKVVGDFLGGLDPVFGVLLNVTGGRIGRGDTPWFHKLFCKKEYLAYHAAVHDAFGYLITYHDKGPGYNYIKSKWTLFNTVSPHSCQFAGFGFWKRLMQKPDEVDEF